MRVKKRPDLVGTGGASGREKLSYDRRNVLALAFAGANARGICETAARAHTTGSASVVCPARTPNGLHPVGGSPFCECDLSV